MQSTGKTAGYREPVANRISGVIPSLCAEIAAPKSPRLSAALGKTHLTVRHMLAAGHSVRMPTTEGAFCVVESRTVLAPLRGLSYPQGHVIVKPNLLIFNLIGGYGF